MRVTTTAVSRFQLGAQSVAVVTDHPLLQRLLVDGLFPEFVRLPGTVVEIGDLLVELFDCHPNATPLISEPLLPLKGTPVHLRRERELRGWVLGDLLHIEDGLHSLDLHYVEGRARGLFDIDAIVTTPRLLTHTYALLAIVELLRTRDIYFMHGACAINPRDGGGVLLLGDGGSGKSTTTYLLLRQGWTYVGDDTLLMQRTPAGRVQVVPLLRRFLLHGMLTHRFPGLMLEKLQADGKGVVAPASLGGSARPQALPDHALLLQHSKKNISTVAPVRKSTLLAELIRQNQFLFMHSHLAARHLELLTQLCKQCDANRLEVGEDILLTPNKLVTLLDRYDRAHATEHYF